MRKTSITPQQLDQFRQLGEARLKKMGITSEEFQLAVIAQGGVYQDKLEEIIREMIKFHQRSIEPHILARKTFDPEQFIGEGWTIDERIGKRSDGNLDAGQITRKDYSTSDVSYINGEERLQCIKITPDDIQLDGEDFLALYEEKDQLTLRWLYETKGFEWLSFWGIILRDPEGNRKVLYLYRDVGGSWVWRCLWVDIDDWYSSIPSAVLASPLAEAKA
ncbi:MAG: hypothetical protein WCV85_00380 [Patescibacteria group bacterium]